MSLGITAMELFACNPYRVLGVAVNTPEEKIAETYKKLLSMAQRGTIRDYSTEFDFPDALPPFERSEVGLRTAYAKLASNGYRCYAYADGQFSAALNIDDVMLNLRDVTCYDCFLRCYMWLITNDRNFEEPELWISLCKYIDKMIMSEPDEWPKYFDNRFPERMIDSSLSVYRSFYATFCELILLPIKELARGSMKCKTAMDILRIAGVDVAEEFEYIEIPQANLPKAGEPAPLLKIAAKTGDEYYDVSAGVMKSFNAATTKVESNKFDFASSSISADAIISDEEPADLKLPRAKVLGEFEENKDTIIPNEPKPSPMPTHTYSEPEPAPQQVAEPVKPHITASEPKPSVSYDFPIQPDAEPKINFPAKKEKSSATVVSPSDSAEQETKHVEEIITPMRRNRVVPAQPKADVSQTYTAANPAVTNTPVQPFAPSSATVSSEQPVSGEAKKPYKRTAKRLTSLVEQTDDLVSELSIEDEDENDYTQMLIKMLRSNRSSHQMMKDADTKHAFNNGDSLGTPDDAKLSMDAINMKNYDKSRLGYSLSADETDPKKLRDEKYKDISIGDMLNPTLGMRTQRGYETDAIQEFHQNKANTKKARNTIIKVGVFLIFAVVVYLILFFAGII